MIKVEYYYESEANSNLWYLMIQFSRVILNLVYYLTHL